MWNAFTKFYKIEKKSWICAYYIQSIIDNLRARCWNMGPEYELGVPWKKRGGARRAEQFPTLEIIL